MNAADNPQLSAQTLAASAALRREMGMAAVPQIEAGTQALRDHLRAAIGESFDDLCRAGETMDELTALDDALQPAQGPQSPEAEAD